MRDPDRLEKFYNSLQLLHEWYCPDWRFGQLISNFLCWLGNDGFYLEEEDYAKKLNEYLNTLVASDDMKIEIEGE